MSLNTALVLPNTNMELRGKKPRAWEKKFCYDNHICDRCRSVWVEPNKINCESCASKIAMYAEAHRGGKKVKALKKKDRNPTMVDIIVNSVSPGQNSLDNMDISMTSDTGTIVNVKNVNVALRYIDKHGKAHIMVFREKEVIDAPAPSVPVSAAATRSKVAKAKMKLLVKKPKPSVTAARRSTALVN